MIWAATYTYTRSLSCADFIRNHVFQLHKIMLTSHCRNDMWPSIRKHVLYTKAFSRGFMSQWNPLETRLQRVWNPLETLLKRFGNPFKTLWNSLETLLKHFGNPFEMLWKPFWNALKRLGNPFKTLWKRFVALQNVANNNYFYCYGSNTL